MDYNITIQSHANVQKCDYHACMNRHISEYSYGEKPYMSKSNAFAHITALNSYIRFNRRGTYDRDLKRHP